MKYLQDFKAENKNDNGKSNNGLERASVSDGNINQEEIYAKKQRSKTAIFPLMSAIKTAGTKWKR